MQWYPHRGRFYSDESVKSFIETEIDYIVYIKPTNTLTTFETNPQIIMMYNGTPQFISTDFKTTLTYVFNNIYPSLVQEVAIDGGQSEYSYRIEQFRTYTNIYITQL